MKKILFISAAVIALCSCSKAKKTDAELLELKGNVKSVEQKELEVVRSNGNEVLETMENQYMGNRSIVSYNKNGNVVLETVTDSQGSLLQKMVYSRDKNDWVTEVTMQDERGEWVNKYTIKHDDSGNEIERLMESRSQPESNMKYVSVYDGDGNEIEVTGFKENKMAFKLKNTFDKNGNKIKIVEFDDQNKPSGQSVETTYNDKNQKLTEKSFRNGTEMASYTFKYDANGNLVSQTVSDGANKETYTFTYKIDNKGNWTSRTTFIKGKPETVTERKITYY